MVFMVQGKKFLGKLGKLSYLKYLLFILPFLFNHSREFFWPILDIHYYSYETKTKSGWYDLHSHSEYLSFVNGDNKEIKNFIHNIDTIGGFEKIQERIYNKLNKKGIEYERGKLTRLYPIPEKIYPKETNFWFDLEKAFSYFFELNKNYENLHYLKTPDETLKSNGKCGNLSILYASCLENKNIEVALVYTFSNKPHMLVSAKPKKGKIPKNTNFKNYYFQDKQGNHWLPIDVRFYEKSIFGSSFEYGVINGFKEILQNPNNIKIYASK